MADLDGNGLDDLGGGGGLGGDGEETSAAHLTVHKEVSIGITSARKVEVWQGPYEELLEMAEGYDFAEAATDEELPEGDSDTSGSEWGYPHIIDAKVVRENGGVGRLTVVKNQNRHVAHISIDFTEVQRPIKTWHADKESGAPDLAAIRTWEAKEETDYAEYAAFTGLSDDTKTLAEMIFKGIEHYSVYRPVVTITLTTDDAPQLALYPIGSVSSEPEIPYGWTDIHGKTVTDLLAGGDEYVWVLGASRATPNADGTYQWVLQYQACDSVEEALFEGDVVSSAEAAEATEGGAE